MKEVRVTWSIKVLLLDSGVESGFDGETIFKNWDSFNEGGFTGRTLEFFSTIDYSIFLDGDIKNELL